uniref:ATP synthase F0 subunit 8 n=1 Tax=Mycetophylax simplex TaxID=341688 RepID=UPI0030035A56
MPQMMPMYWSIMLLSQIILLFIFSSFTYFYTPFISKMIKKPIPTWITSKHLYWTWKW